jgi:hypothetical protein
MAFGSCGTPEDADVAVRLALPKRGVAPSFPPVREPLFEGPAKDAVVAQLVRAPVCGTGGRWFEPTQLYHHRKILRGFSIVLIDLTYLPRLKYKERCKWQREWSR